MSSLFLNQGFDKASSHLHLILNTGKNLFYIQRIFQSYIFLLRWLLLRNTRIPLFISYITYGLNVVLYWTLVAVKQSTTLPGIRSLNVMRELENYLHVVVCSCLTCGYVIVLLVATIYDWYITIILWGSRYSFINRFSALL